MSNHITTEIADKAQGMSWFGAFSAGLGFLTLTEWLALGGFTLALIGAVVNAWYKYKLVQIEQTRLDHDMKNDSKI